VDGNSRINTSTRQLLFILRGNADINDSTISDNQFYLNDTIRRYKYSDETSSNIVSAMFNYCSLCVNSTDILVQNLTTCSLLYNNLQAKADRKHCPENRSILHTNHETSSEIKSEIFVCMCRHNDPQSIGFDCSVYSRALLKWAYYLEPIIFIPLLSPIVVGQTMYIIIPMIAKIVMIWRKHSDSSLRWKLGETFAVKNQASAALYLSTICGYIAQVLAIFYPIALVDDYSLPRIAAFILLTLCYALVLIQWAHAARIIANSIVDEEGKRLSKFHLGFVIVLYLFLIALIIADLIFMIAGLLIAAYIATTAALILFFCVFPFGFTIYGLFIYRTIRNNIQNNSSHTLSKSNPKKNINLLHFKFTRFVLACNILVGSQAIIAVLYALGFSISWDYLGLFLGVSRTIIIDVTLALLHCVISFMLAVDTDTMEQVYGSMIGRTLMCTFWSDLYPIRVTKLQTDEEGESTNNNTNNDTQSPTTPAEQVVQDICTPDENAV
jgi:hypothetical protein